MKLKRYFAPDMRQAIKMVREAQGPDAVILSNRRIDGGVEIVAAIDYDEALVQKMAAPRQPATPASPQTQSDPAAGKADAEAPRAPRPIIEWTQDPSLVAMREEIKNLRGLLECQLSGLAWGAAKRRNPRRTKLLERLTRLGLGAGLSRSVADRTRLGDNLENNWRQALGLVAQRVPIAGDTILDHGGVVAVVGPTGVGKTTTAAKLAARYALRHGRNRVALVTTDSYRIGAHQQLRTFGNIIGVPVQLVQDGEQLRQTLTRLRDKSLVLIDTAGMSQRDMRLAGQFALLQQGGRPLRVFVVLSTTTQRAALDEVVRAFAGIKLDGCLLTKLDETTGIGEALSVVIEHRLPVAYVSDGQRVPEDLLPARANNLVARSVALMQKHAEKPAEEAMALAFGRLVGNADG